MKIAYILPVYWPAFGGCELHTHELVGRLSERFAIRVITQITRQEDKPGDLWLGTLVKAIPRRERYFDNKAEVVPVRMNPLERHILCPFVRLHRGMEVFSMGIIDYVFQRKIFGLLKDSDLIHCIHNGASFYGYAAMHCAKRLDVPFVFTPLFQLYQLWNESASGMKEENGNVWELTRGRHLHAHLSARCYHDRFWFDVCRAADALITMTGFEKEFFVGHGIAAGKIHPVGVGPLISKEYDAAAFRKKYGIGNRKMVLFLGRKSESKGIEEVLKSALYVWEKHPETIFCFVGPKEGGAARIFKKYEEERIREIGAVDLVEKTSALKACDIFCMPSFYEALGGVFLEAWMFEKPVIAGNTPPLRELTGDGRGGFLVNLDSHDIAEKITELLNDEKLRKKQGSWGKDKVRSTYSWDIIADKMESVYRTVAGQHQGVLLS